MCGLGEGTKFSFPEMKEDKQFLISTMCQRVLEGIRYSTGSGFAIYSIKLLFNDGETP